MNRFRKLLVVIFLLTPWWMSSVAFAQQVEERYVINFKGDKLPADLEAQIQAAGGVLARTLPEVGIAIAVSADSNFASAIAASKNVTSAGLLPFYSSSFWTERLKKALQSKDQRMRTRTSNKGICGASIGSMPHKRGVVATPIPVPMKRWSQSLIPV